MSADKSSAGAAPAKRENLPRFEQTALTGTQTHASKLDAGGEREIKVIAVATIPGINREVVSLTHSDCYGAATVFMTQPEAVATARELLRAAGAQDAAAINAQLLEELRNMVETFRPNASGSDGNRTDALNDAERAIAAAEAQGGSAAQLQPLTDEQIEAGRKATFSTDNPFCPCDSKTMRKAVRWAERTHGIGAAAEGK